VSLHNNEPLTLREFLKFAGLAVVLAAAGFVSLLAFMIYF